MDSQNPTGKELFVAIYNVDCLWLHHLLIIYYTHKFYTNMLVIQKVIHILADMILNIFLTIQSTQRCPWTRDDSDILQEGLLPSGYWIYKSAFHQRASMQPTCCFDSSEAMSFSLNSEVASEALYVSLSLVSPVKRVGISFSCKQNANQHIC